MKTIDDRDQLLLRTEELHMLVSGINAHLREDLIRFLIDYFAEHGCTITLVPQQPSEEGTPVLH